MLSYDIFTILTKNETLKTIVISILVFGLGDKMLKGKLNQLIDYLVLAIVKGIPLIIAKFRQESIDHFNAIPAPSPLTRKLLAWGTVIVNVLFSALMTVYGMVFLILTAMILLKAEPSLPKVLVGGLIGGVLLFIAYYYRAGAYKTARANDLL